MDRKVEPERPPISPADRADRRRGEAGFTLIEIVCVIAIVAALAAIVLPAIPRATSRARLESYAIGMASVLKADRAAAVRRRISVAADVRAAERILRSGSTTRVVHVPDDVKFDALLAARCNERPGGSSIRFFASGMSCGGVITITRLGVGYEVRVNWFTGGVDVVPVNAL